jgi:hypothetical protein
MNAGASDWKVKLKRTVKPAARAIRRRLPTVRLAVSTLRRYPLADFYVREFGGWGLQSKRVGSEGTRGIEYIPKRVRRRLGCCAMVNETREEAARRGAASCVIPSCTRDTNWSQADVDSAHLARLEGRPCRGVFLAVSGKNMELRYASVSFLPLSNWEYCDVD